MFKIWEMEICGVLIFAGGQDYHLGEASRQTSLNRGGPSIEEGTKSHRQPRSPQVNSDTAQCWLQCTVANCGTDYARWFIAYR